MLLNDHEVGIDLLYYETIARTVVNLIRQDPETPITLAVYGGWGSGKSTILAMIKAALAAENSIVCLQFSGWLLQDFEDAKTAFIEDIVAGLRRVWPSTLKDKGQFNHLPPHRLQERLEESLAAADVDQLVILIDDLDYCSPKTVIQILEAIRFFSSIPHTAVVITADAAMIEYAVQQYLSDLPTTVEPAVYARNYSEKLIQVPVHIPALGFAETCIYVTLLLVQSQLGRKDEQFLKLLDIARQTMRRPWQGSGIDRRALEECFGRIPPLIGQALELSEQITRILIDATQGNPRRIKRFINAMLLRYALVKARGMAEEIAWPVLVKIMLAERFAPAFYEQLSQLVFTAVDGKPKALAHLEEVIYGESAAKSTAKGPSPADAIAAESSDWLTSEWISNWAVINPPLKAIDLRPYVFMTSKRRNILTGLAWFGHLETLVQRLFGSPLAAKGAEPELMRLTSTEAEWVFEALCKRILQTSDFSEKPPGFDGLDALVARHPFLQRSLLDFIQSLPANRLGSWVVTAWPPSLNDPHMAKEFQKQLDAWSQQGGNEPLRMAAAQALHPPRKIPLVKTIVPHLTQPFAIAGGGSLGATLRFWISNEVHAVLGRDFPYGTLVVNILGCLLMGLLFVLFLERLSLGSAWRAGILVGLLGAFTTFSIFTLETLTLLQQGVWLAAAANIVLSVFIGLAATWLGMIMGRRLSNTPSV